MSDTKNLEQIEQSVMKKFTMRPVLILFIVYILNFLDRTNIGIAKLNMSSDLGLSEAAYGLGAGLFFIGYILFEIPSNMILYRVGARFWITRIMISWGIVSAAMAYVQNETWFYILRFLLGVAETGLVPGVLLYLTFWVPQKNRAKIMSYFYLAVPVATIIGAPISSYLMTIDAFGLPGWRFMFLAEGIPSVLMAIGVWFFLTDKPEDAKWLNSEEKKWLIDRLEEDKVNQDSNAHSAGTVLEAIKDPLVIGVSISFFSMVIPLYALSFFLPTIVAQMGKGNYSTLTIGFLTAIPYVFASIGLLLISHSSDKKGERTYHYALPAIFGAIMLAASSFAVNTSPALALLGMSLGAIGCISTLPSLWAQVPFILKGVAIAGGIAVINSFGNIAGFVAPYLIGLLRDNSSTPEVGTQISILSVSAFLLLAGIVMILVGFGIKKRQGSL